jgi:hypothetical protein
MILLSLFTAGCDKTSKYLTWASGEIGWEEINGKKIFIGQHGDTVLKKLGPPENRKSVGNNETWAYGPKRIHFRYRKVRSFSVIEVVGTPNASTPVK